jgi:hypothetical protein
MLSKISLILILCFSLYGQVVTIPDNVKIKDLPSKINQNFNSTVKFTSGETIPSTCDSSKGIAFLKTDTNQWYDCLDTNVYGLRINAGADGKVNIGNMEFDPTNGFKGPTFPCVGSPGDTTGPHRAFCISSSNQTYICANGDGCSVADDWVTQTNDSFPGVSSNNNNGLNVLGEVAIGVGQPTKITVNSTTINELPGNAGCAALLALNPTWPVDYCTPVQGQVLQINDGTDAADSTVGGGSNEHYVKYTPTGYVSLNSTGPTGPAGAPVSSPETISTNCNGTQNWAITSGKYIGRLTLTGSCVLTISNMSSGGFYAVIVTQGAGGSHTLTLGTGSTSSSNACTQNSDFKVGGGGAGAVTPTAAAGSVDVLAILYEGTYCLSNYRGNFD